MSTARENAPSFGWMLARSLWILLLVMPGAVLAWLGFLLLGILSRRRSAYVLAGVFAAIAITVALPVWGVWGGMARGLAVVAALLTGVGVNPRWLRDAWAAKGAKKTPARTAAKTGGAHASTKTGRGRTAAKAKPAKATSAKAAHAGASAASHRKPSAPASDPAAARLLDAVDGDSDDLIEAAPADADANTTAAADAATSGSDDAIDVNSASAAVLSALPGMTPTRARKAVARREAHGPFASLDDFAQVAGLQPHQLVRLRSVAVCTPAPQAPRSFGRRVDY